jgi:TetR/AcrR family transcriptional regulator, regulator of mycofactocin system
VTATTAPSPTTRRARRTAQTRRAIVEAAHLLFEERGFADTTVDDIAEQADVAPRTFFRYFATKEAVLFADFEELHAELLALVAARPAGESHVQAMVAALRQYATLLRPRLPAIIRSIELAEECGAAGAEPALLRARMLADLADALAQRSGTTVEADPRAQLWAGVAVACFGAALKLVVRDEGDLDAVFLQLVAEAGAGLSAAVPGEPAA